MKKKENRRITKKKWLVIFSLIIVIGILLLIIIKNKPSSRPYIIERKHKNKILAAKLDYRKEDFSPAHTKEIFSSEIVNEHTLNFLLHLDEVCRDAVDFADNIKQAKEYLLMIFPPETAEKLLNLYKTYLNYQISLQEKKAQWGMPKTPQEALEGLMKLQQYRREVFGKEVADIIFGASVEAQEYTIRRNAILHDEGLYAATKERLLRELNLEMWGDEVTADNNDNSYNRYQEALLLYKRDIAEMRSEEEREGFLAELRRQIFNPEQLKGLEQTEHTIAEEAKQKETYLCREREILNDPDLTIKEREEKIRELQDEIFGEQAEAFRRRQALYETISPQR